MSAASHFPHLPHLPGRLRGRPFPGRGLPAGVAAVRAPTTAALGRTLAVAGYLVVLAVAGRPAWLAVLLGLALVVVWVLPAALRDRPGRSRTVPSRGPDRTG